MSEQHVLPPPVPNQAYVEVSALEAGLIDIPGHLIVEGAGPEDVQTCPSLAFFIRHVPSGEHLVFDLGIRRDTTTFPPSVLSTIERYMKVQIPQTADESLAKDGMDPKDVRTILLSHLHFDHIGDASAFPNATFVLGPGSREVLDGTATRPGIDLVPTCVPRDDPARLRFLAPSDFSARVGPFPRAHDFFGDGSLYVLDAAGHCTGHVNVLARTSRAGAWLLLAGDAAHDVRLLTGERALAVRVHPETGRVRCAHVDKDAAMAHLERVKSLVGVPGVQVLLAHDWEWYEANRGGPAFFPGTIPPMDVIDVTN